MDRGDAAALVIGDCVLDIGYSNKTEFQYPRTNREFPMMKERPMDRGDAAALVIGDCVLDIGYSSLSLGSNKPRRKVRFA